MLTDRVVAETDEPILHVSSANVTKAVFQNSSIVGCSETKENTASAPVGIAARSQVDPPASRQMERHMRNRLQVDQ